jgi:hypothetical protein
MGHRREQAWGVDTLAVWIAAQLHRRALPVVG